MHSAKAGEGPGAFSRPQRAMYYSQLGHCIAHVRERGRR
jgi:hypothetical protein